MLKTWCSIPTAVLVEICTPCMEDINPFDLTCIHSGRTTTMKSKSYNTLHKKLADDQCSSVTKGSISYIKHMYAQFLSMEVDWPGIWCLMEVSVMFYICTYCVCTECWVIGILLCIWDIIIYRILTRSKENISTDHFFNCPIVSLGPGASQHVSSVSHRLRLYNRINHSQV